MRSILSLGTLLGCLLLLQGCDAPPKPSGNFHHAVQTANLVQVKRHLYWGTDPSQRGPGGQPPLNLAVRDGKVAIAKELLKHGADPMAAGPNGDTALMTALDQGVALGSVGPQGRTPLALAVRTGSVNIAKFLLERGAPLAPAGKPDKDAPEPRVPAAEDIDDPVMAQLLRRYGVID